MKKISIILLLLCLPIIALAQTKTVNLSLTDANNPAGTKHYCYHRLTGGTYGTSDRKDLGTALTYAWVLTAPALGSHFWACTAYVVDGTNTLQSDYSNEVTWTNAPVPPVLSITSIAAAPQFKGVILQARTNMPATTYVEYGLNANLTLSTQNGEAAPDIVHQISIDKLRPHATYYYRWSATASDGTKMQSQILTFTTL